MHEPLEGFPSVPLSLPWVKNQYSQAHSPPVLAHTWRHVQGRDFCEGVHISQSYAVLNQRRPDICQCNEKGLGRMKCATASLIQDTRASISLPHGTKRGKTAHELEISMRE